MARPQVLRSHLDVEIAFLLDALCDHGPDRPRGRRRQVRHKLVHELVGECLERGEGGVQHHGCNRRVPVSMEQRGGGPHAPAPEANRRDFGLLPEVFHHHLATDGHRPTHKGLEVRCEQMRTGGVDLDVLSFPPSQGDKIAIREAGAAKIEREERDAEREHDLENLPRNA